MASGFLWRRFSFFARSYGFARLLRGGHFAAFAGSPARLVDLTAAGNAQAVGRNIFRDGGTGGDVGAVADAHRGDQCRIAADKYSLANLCGVLLEAVVIAGNGAGSDVGFGADAGVSQVREMRNLRAFADDGLLRFHKVADA